MTVQLFKLVAESTLSNTQYFQAATADYTITTTPTTIDATSFLNSDGSAVTAFATATSNGYYSLEVGGVLQQTGIFTVSAAGLSIALTTGNTLTYTITTSTPITLAVTETSVTV